MSQEQPFATLCSFALCKTKCAFPEDCMQLPEPTPLTDAAEQECRCTVNGAIISGVVTAAFTRQLERKARVMQRVLEKQTTVSETAQKDERIMDLEREVLELQARIDQSVAASKCSHGLTRKNCGVCSDDPVFSAPSATPQKPDPLSPAAITAEAARPDPMQELATYIKESIRLCDHGYIHITCGRCTAPGLQP